MAPHVMQSARQHRRSWNHIRHGTLASMATKLSNPTDDVCRRTVPAWGSASSPPQLRVLVHLAVDQRVGDPGAGDEPHGLERRLRPRRPSRRRTAGNIELVGPVAEYDHRRRTVRPLPEPPRAGRVRMSGRQPGGHRQDLDPGAHTEQPRRVRVNVFTGVLGSASALAGSNMTEVTALEASDHRSTTSATGQTHPPGPISRRHRTRRPAHVLDASGATHPVYSVP